MVLKVSDSLNLFFPKKSINTVDYYLSDLYQSKLQLCVLDEVIGKI